MNNKTMISIFHKTIILVLALIMSVTSYADNVEINGIFYDLNKATKEATVTRGVLSSSYASYKGDINIPSSVTYNDTTYIVTSIGENAFFFYKDINSITIPNSITSIGDRAFCSCEGLNSITIPNSTTSIGKDSFVGCKRITSVIIPSSVTSIGIGAFASCPNLDSIIVDKGNKTYDSRNECNAIIETTTNKIITGCKTTIIPESVTSIGDKAFYNCEFLTSIKIPNSVTVIGNYAFVGCNNLIAITLPQSVRSIGDGVFKVCQSLTTVNIPDSVTSIGDMAFCGCEKITSTSIPESVKNIGEDAFRDCHSITSIYIPQSVICIGEDAFTNCTSLTSIKVDKNNTKYDSRNDCNGIINTSTNEFIKGCVNSTIPESVTSISKNAFSSCKNLRSIIIPQSVKTIGESAFANCNSLKSVTIHDSVTSIGAKAFWGCGFSSFKIPSNLTYIGSEVFTYTNLEHITIPASLTNIDPNAFQYCINLKSVTNLSKIPQKITYYTFQKEDHAHGPVTIIPVKDGDTSTEYTQHIEHSKKEAEPIILFVPKNCKKAYQKAEGWKLFQIEELEE